MMLAHIFKDVGWIHFLTDFLQVHQQYAGIEIAVGLMLGNPDFADGRGYACQALMHGGCVEITIHLCFIQRPKLSDHQDIGIQI